MNPNLLLRVTAVVLLLAASAWIVLEGIFCLSTDDRYGRDQNV